MTFRIRYIITAGIVFTALGFLAGMITAHFSDREQDQRLVDLFRSSAGKPWQWKAKEVIYDYIQVRRALLVRHDYMTSNKDIRKQLKQLEKEIQLGINWNESVREYILPRLPETEKENGFPKISFWEKSLTWNGEYPLNQTVKQTDSAIWQLCYDAEYLYFRASFPDTDISVSPQKALYDQDSFEIFIMPERRYYTYTEIIVSADNRQYTKWVSQTERSRYELSDYTPSTLKTRTKTEKDGWSIEGKIGFSDLPAYLRGNPAKSGETLHLMMIRINSENQEKKMFSPVPFLYEGHNFFGYMKLTLQ